MEGGRGFQFTPGGLTDLGDASAPIAEEFSPAFVPKPEPAPFVRAVVAFAKDSEFAPLRNGLAVGGRPLIGPREVVRAAKARAKHIRVELRRMKALQKELAELERLIAAAAKPLAAVRPIDSARHAR